MGLVVGACFPRILSLDRPVPRELDGQLLPAYAFNNLHVEENLGQIKIFLGDAREWKRFTLFPVSRRRPVMQ